MALRHLQTSQWEQDSAFFARKSNVNIAAITRNLKYKEKSVGHVESRATVDPSRSTVPTLNTSTTIYNAINPPHHDHAQDVYHPFKVFFDILRMFNLICL